MSTAAVLPSGIAAPPQIERTLMDGRGFVRLRGIDRSRYSQSEMEMLYWGIGMHLGSPWPQNKRGHVLGDVTDQGKRGDDPTARGNEIGGAALPFHCDGSDLVGLLSLENGLEGGLSAVAACALSSFAFDTLGLHRIEAHVAADNPASQRVVEKIGFQREGIARENERIGERFVDHVQYALLARDQGDKP